MLAYVEVLVAPLWQIPEFESNLKKKARLLHPQRLLRRRPAQRAGRLRPALAHAPVQRAWPLPGRVKIADISRYNIDT